MQLAVAARSDVGMIRSGNEDNFFADLTGGRGLFVVADGMGGHAAGEVASEMAVAIIADALTGLVSVDAPDAPERDIVLGNAPLTVDEVIDAVEDAMRGVLAPEGAGVRTG